MLGSHDEIVEMLPVELERAANIIKERKQTFPTQNPKRSNIWKKHADMRKILCRKRKS